MNNQRKRRAFFSVWHKVWKGRDILEIARLLVEQGWEIEASGGTCKHLRNGGITCLDIADRVGVPILGHRVVTLSREFMAGLLAQDTPEDQAELDKHGIPRIDMVVCNLYPLTEEIAKLGATRADVIEKTDIGGPSMIRAAAKGRRIVVSSADCYGEVIDWLKAGCPDEERFITEGAAKAEYDAASYALASAAYHGDGAYAGLVGTCAATCKYGENPYMQPAELYATETDDPLALHRFTLVDGDAPSYINWTDVHRLLDTATRIAAGYDVNHGSVPVIAVGGKHGNACGAAISPNGSDVTIAIRGMINGDRTAIFGGLVLLTCPVGKREADVLRFYGMSGEQKRLLDGVIAPSFTEEAVAILGRKGGKCRCIANPALAELTRASLDPAQRLRPVRGGFLLQPANPFVLDLNDARIKAYGALSDADRTNIILAWAVGSTSTSNTITLVRQGMVVANAVGQQDRVGAAQLAIMRAKRNGHDTRGATAYSDSFFPFSDGPVVLVEAGIRTIFASSGSVKDEDVMFCCKAAGVTLVMMPDKDCRGFYGH